MAKCMIMSLFISTFAKVFISQLLPIITTWPLALETGVLSVPQIFSATETRDLRLALLCSVVCGNLW